MTLSWYYFYKIKIVNKNEDNNKTYIDIIQPYDENTTSDNIIISIFSKNENHIPDSNKTNSYAFKYTVNPYIPKIDDFTENFTDNNIENNSTNNPNLNDSTEHVSYDNNSICNTTFNCCAYYFFENECSPNIINDAESAEFIFLLLDEIEEGYFKDIFKNAIEEDKNYIKIENNITYQISTVSSQKLTNLSVVGLEECESHLKNAYLLDQKEKLILLKLEYKIENFEIPIIEYQLFTKEGKKLDMTYCEHFDQTISIPVSINENEEFIHNPNSSFYQDKCTPYKTEYATDITIYDRKKDYNEKFLALCEQDCTYKGYNYNTKRVTCECKTKIAFPKLATEKIDVKELLNKFVDFKKNFFNIYVIICLKQTFSSKGMKKNWGSYINIIIIAFASIFTILFWIKGYNSLLKKINNILKAKFQKYNEEQNETSSDIQIDIKKDNQIQTNFYNDYEINNLKYSEALEIDKRSFFESYFSLIKTKHIIFFTFFIENDYNSKEIKICLFLFWLSLNYATNALFFYDSTLHQIYIDKGKYNFLYQLPFTIYSILISFVLTNLLTIFAIFEGNIAEIAKKKTFKKETEINNYLISLKCKFRIFFIFIILFFLFFWYYLSSFCSVFINTQISLLIDTIISFSISLFYPFIIVIITCSMRYCALKAEKKNKKCLYNFSDILGDFLLQLH